MADHIRHHNTPDNMIDILSPEELANLKFYPHSEKRNDIQGMPCSKDELINYLTKRDLLKTNIEILELETPIKLVINPKSRIKNPE